MTFSSGWAALLQSPAPGCCDNRGLREQPDCDANAVVLLSCCGIYISQSAVILGQFHLTSVQTKQNLKFPVFVVARLYVCQVVSHILITFERKQNPEISQKSNFPQERLVFVIRYSRFLREKVEHGG